MTPAIAPTALDAFEADLTAGGIVTRVLEAWAGGPVRAVRVAGSAEASPETRARLRVGADAPLGFRRVRLMSGELVLSEADNWFVPERLTAAMLATLNATETPFGIVIAPLDPHRETLACTRLTGDPVLSIRALVLDGDEMPLAAVEERYAAACLRC
ncbi:hypothetical protein ASE86_05290 [Sphingomonas sp. Leaf33]|uniref:hypothetical protein n=1 Tax=Sphingomonas sp. Leaf33 TaxID=1736215 RepID=UPI0006F3BB4F|nr:hypothetical protein [Sphingomonas sp. Leaf33]KQN25627.1 hypothetical protein ASE86_05290 [Sphingomonas sp. Leaf33]